MQVQLPVYNARTCQRRFGELILETELCAGDEQGGRDACQVKKRKKKEKLFMNPGFIG